ncbi:MAG: hypothetical protein AAFO04_22295 [Cyanobacteria bacterium J06592_8]
MTSATCVLSGVMIIGLTHYQPSAYWDSPSRLFWRKLIGNLGTALLYDLIGVSLVLLGSIIYF